MWSALTSTWWMLAGISPSFPLPWLKAILRYKERKKNNHPSDTSPSKKAVGEGLSDSQCPSLLYLALSPAKSVPGMVTLGKLVDSSLFEFSQRNPMSTWTCWSRDKFKHTGVAVKGSVRNYLKGSLLDSKNAQRAVASTEIPTFADRQGS